MALHDRLRQPGRAAGIQHPERMVERDGVEHELGAGRSEEHVGEAVAAEISDPHERPADLGVDLLDDRRAVEVAPAIAVAVDCQQHLGLDLREAVHDRARAEIRRAARPDRAEPGGGEERRDGLGDVRHVGGDAVAAADAAGAQARLDAGRQRPQLAPRHRVQRAQLRGVADRDGVLVAVAEDVLGIGQRRAVKPARAGHLGAIEDRLRRLVEPHAEVLGDRGPEALDVADRPFPQLVVARHRDAVKRRQPVAVGAQTRALRERLVGLPQHLRLAAFLHAASLRPG